MKFQNTRGEGKITSFLETNKQDKLYVKDQGSEPVVLNDRAGSLPVSGTSLPTCSSTPTMLSIKCEGGTQNFRPVKSQFASLYSFSETELMLPKMS